MDLKPLARYGAMEGALRERLALITEAR